MAHKKGVGSTDNGRDSISKRLGVKLFGGQAAVAGNIIVRQRGTKYHPGENVYMGKDYTLHARVDGTVVFTKRRKNRVFVSIEPETEVATATKPVPKKKTLPVPDTPNVEAQLTAEEPAKPEAKAAPAPKVEETKAEEKAPKAKAAPAPKAEETKAEEKAPEAKAAPKKEEAKAEKPKTELKGEAAPAPKGKIILPSGKKIKADDLKIVEGIGPKIESLLHDAGIKNWKDLAEAPAEKIQAILDEAGSRYRMHSPATWSKQAKLAFEAKWEELEAYQDRLEGGREPEDDKK